MEARTLSIVEGKRSHEECLFLLFSKFEKNPTEKLSLEIFQCSLLLLDEYISKLKTVKDLMKWYLLNGEQRLWKNVVYNVVEVLRNVASSDSSDSIKYKTVLINFIDQALNFYFKLLDKYEEFCSPQKFADAFYWPENSTPFCLERAFVISNTFESTFFKGDLKIVLRSAQRHFLAIGDLFRYKSSLVDSDLNLKCARKWYFKAVQANFHNGRSFNQMGVLASQSRNFLDMIFYYVLAISAKHPFSSSRESLGIACSQIQQIPSVAKELKVEKQEKIAKAKSVVANSRRDKSPQVEELWILPNNENSSEGRSFFKSSSNNSIVPFDAKTQRIVLFKILHLTGILLTNIGMESFDRIKEKTFFDLFKLIHEDESIITSSNLLKITLSFIFAASHVKPGASEFSLNSQREYALNAILDIFNMSLNVAVDALEKTKTEDIFVIYKSNHSFNRVLPTLCVLSEWILSPPKTISDAFMSGNYFVKSTTLFDFTELLNNIQTLIEQGRIAKFGVQQNKILGEQANVALPESIIVASFNEIFSNFVPKYSTLSNKIETIKDIEVVTLHCRLNAILLTAEKVCQGGSSSPPHLPHFKIKKREDGKSLYSWESFINITNTEAPARKYSNKTSLNKKNKFCNPDDELLKKDLLDECNEIQKHKIIFEICPRYLIPDTNTFIDHLELIKRIVISGKFIVLVPTTVLTELCSLSTDAASRRASGILSQKLLAALSPELGPNSKARNVQMQYVKRQANATMDFLKKAADDRNLHIATVTSKGNILPRVSFAQEATNGSSMQTNDDRILACCIELCKIKDMKNISCFYENSEENPIIIKRNTVFLTEDRALCVKAASSKIPIRSAPEFVKWSGL